MMVKMPIACFLLILYSFYFYKRTKRVRTYAAFIFECMIYCVLVNLVADAVTEFTVNHRDMVSETFNYTWHIIFMESILGVCFLIYAYLITYVERGAGVNKELEKQISRVAFAASALAILVLPIEYIDTEYGSYSLGPKAYALYAGIIYVMALMVYNLVRYWKRVEKSRREVMLISILIFVAFSFLQMLFPYILTTGLAMSMIVMGIMLTSEDSNRYIDERREFFNEEGCREMLREHICHEKSFELPVYMFIGGQTKVDAVLRETAVYMEAHHNCVAAVLGQNMMVFFPRERFWEKRTKNFEKLPQFARNERTVQEFSMIIKSSRYSTEEEIMKRLWEFQAANEEQVLYKDAMTDVYNRNAYERDAASIQERKTSLWYFLADINGLKKVNDTFGHAAGDELIRGVATLLKETFAEKGRVYRIGGDEFVVLYKGRQAKHMVEELERRRDRMNEGRRIPLQFAVGYAYYDAKREIWEEIMRRADYNMYAEKMQSRGKEDIWNRKDIGI